MGHGDWHAKYWLSVAFQISTEMLFIYDFRLHVKYYFCSWQTEFLLSYVSLWLSILFLFTLFNKNLEVFFLFLSKTDGYAWFY